MLLVEDAQLEILLASKHVDSNLSSTDRSVIIAMITVGNLSADEVIESANKIVAESLTNDPGDIVTEAVGYANELNRFRPQNRPSRTPGNPR